jgi:hypothetical protein
MVVAQHLGDDSHTLPDGSATTKYALLRKPLADETWGANDYETVNLTASFGGSGNTTLLIDRRFYMAENWPNKYTVAGTAYCAAKVGVKGDGTNATRITSVKFTLEKVTSGGTYSNLASPKTITLSTAFATTSTSYASAHIHAIIDVDEATVQPTQELVMKIQVYGNMATGGAANSVRLYYYRGQADTYAELPIEEQL